MKYNYAVFVVVPVASCCISRCVAIFNGVFACGFLDIYGCDDCSNLSENFRP